MKTGILGVIAAAALVLECVLLCNAMPAYAQEKAPLYGMHRERPRMMFAGINVADVKRSAEFYVNVLGMKIANGKSIAELAQQPRGEALLVFADPGQQGGVMLNWNGEHRGNYVVEGSALNRLAIEVEDTAAFLERLRNAGAPITMAARDLRDYVIGIAKDPDGYPLELVQVKYGK